MTSPPFDPARPVQTRGGLPARIVSADRLGHYPIVALVRCREYENIYAFRADGRCCDSDSPNDLINIAPTVHERWAIYDFPQSIGYESKERAEGAATCGRTVCRVTWEA